MKLHDYVLQPTRPASVCGRQEFHHLFTVYFSIHLRTYYFVAIQRDTESEREKFRKVNNRPSFARFAQRSLDKNMNHRRTSRGAFLSGRCIMYRLFESTNTASFPVSKRFLYYYTWACSKVLRTTLATRWDTGNTELERNNKRKREKKENEEKKKRRRE